MAIEKLTKHQIENYFNFNKTGTKLYQANYLEEIQEANSLLTCDEISEITSYHCYDDLHNNEITLAEFLENNFLSHLEDIVSSKVTFQAIHDMYNR